MEAYSHEIPDGPTPFNSVTVKQTQIDEIIGYTLFIFFVSTDDVSQRHSGRRPGDRRAAGWWIGRRSWSSATSCSRNSRRVRPIRPGTFI